MRLNLYNVLYYYQRSKCFGRFFRPSSGAHKSVCSLGYCHAFVLPTAGIVVVELHSRQQEIMTIPKAAHTDL